MGHSRRGRTTACSGRRFAPPLMPSVMWSRQENEKMVVAPPAPLPPTAFLLSSRRRRPAPPASGGIASTTARFTRRRHGRSSLRRSTRPPPSLTASFPGPRPAVTILPEAAARSPDRSKAALLDDPSLPVHRLRTGPGRPGIVESVPCSAGGRPRRVRTGPGSPTTRSSSSLARGAQAPESMAQRGQRPAAGARTVREASFPGSVGPSGPPAGGRPGSGGHITRICSCRGRQRGAAAQESTRGIARLRRTPPQLKCRSLCGRAKRMKRWWSPRRLPFPQRPSC